MVNPAFLALALTCGFEAQQGWFVGAQESGAQAQVRVWCENAGWQAQEADNIVGLRDPRTLSNPVQVDYEALLAKTEEAKRIKRDRIDPNSPKGIQLMNRARQRVADASTRLMRENGYCSVWKNISHSDGRQVTDATDSVARLL